MCLIACLPSFSNLTAQNPKAVNTESGMMKPLNLEVYLEIRLPQVCTPQALEFEYLCIVTWPRNLLFR